MAMIPKNPRRGFQHSTVAAVINEKMAGHAKGPEFFLANASLSWEEVEGKLKAILEDSTVPSEAKEACVWSSLALGMRFAYSQNQLFRQRVQWLHDFANMHKSAAMALESKLKDLMEQLERERMESAFWLRLGQAKVALLQRERDLLRWKIHGSQPCPLPQNLQAAQTQVAEEPGLASTSGAGTEGAGEKEDQAGTAAATVITAGAEGGGKLKDAERAETTKEPAGDPTQLPGAVEQNIHASGRQREGNLRSVETARFYSSGTIMQGSTASAAPTSVQFPASLTCSYSRPLSFFPPAPTQSTSAAMFTAGAPSQAAPRWGPSEVNLWAYMGAQGYEAQEPQRDRRAFTPYQQRRPPIFRRPRNWDCPWCKAIHFSQREICFHCGKEI
ncbi:testis-expressed protein 13B [Manis pentadactyla]|uniref:testis-expressed protein 13B n=1 Tax=Manis pentadactyla TaxID=143292 RepID=UPI00255C7099|nr:testis-expressed protein 13B [Manis pentadactyla]